MKKIASTFILVLLFCTNLNAQYIIDLSHLDYIEIDERSLDGYSKNGNEYIEYEYIGYEQDNDSLMISKNEADTIHSEAIKVSDIASMSIADWEKLLDKHDIIWHDKDEDSEELSLLIKKSPYYMLSAELWYSEETSQYKDNNDVIEYGKVSINGNKYNVLNYKDQYSINYIKLKGDKYLLCLINGSDIYKFIPSKKKPSLTLSPFKLENKLKKSKIELYSAQRDFAYLSIEKKQNSRYFIVNDLGMPMGIEGDAIISSQGPVAVYDKSNNKYELYDPFLNKVNHNYNIRYVKAARKGNWLTFLINNELVWMVHDKIGKNLIRSVGSFSVCGTVSNYTDEISCVDGKIRLEKTKDHQMLRKGVEYFSFDITNAQDIDSLYFYGTSLKQIYKANSYYPFYSTISGIQIKDLLYAKKKNGKYNLYTYKEICSKIYKQTEETFSTIMDVEIGNGEPAKTYSTGKIELEQLLASDVDAITMNSFPIIFQVNNLSGIYPINQKAKYSLLKYSGEEKLMRYELPTGKQGWIDLDNGKELEDILIPVNY